MSTEPEREEVWFADLGMAAKSRPVLILAYPRPEDARALVVVAPLTSRAIKLGEKRSLWYVLGPGWIG